MDANGTVALGGASRPRAGSRRRRSTTSRWSCTRAAAPAGPSACRSRTPTCRSRRGTSRGSYALGPDDVSLCVMPLFHVHGLVASTLATLSTGGTVVVPAKFNPLSFWRIAQRSRRHVVFGGADAAPAAARARQPIRRRGRPAAEKLRFIRSCSAALPPQLMQAARSGVRRAGARGVRHDRSGAPDGIESAAAGRQQAGIGRPRDRRAHQHHGRGRAPSAARRARRSGHQGPERHPRLRKQPRGERDVVRRRLVPHRRSGVISTQTAI